MCFTFTILNSSKTQYQDQQVAWLSSESSVGAAIVGAECSFERNIVHNKEELKTKLKEIPQESDTFNFEKPNIDGNGNACHEVEEVTKVMDLEKHKLLQTVAEDGVAGIKRRRRDLSSDGVRNIAMASRRGRLKDDLESST
ncbi:hypothetical protein Tco_0532211 [Tanacetum coccineum]